MPLLPCWEWFIGRSPKADPSNSQPKVSQSSSKLKSNIVVKLHSAEDSFIPLGMAATSTLPDSQSIYNNAIKLYKDD